MLNQQTIQNSLVEIKRHLDITWSDTDTDAKIQDMMFDAEIALNHILGAEIDYFAPGPERTLYRNYLLYDWNGCINEFRSAYRAEIYEIRHKYEVIQEEGGEDDEE